MKRYTREEMIRESGARPDELAQLKSEGLLVPGRRGCLFVGRREYYTESQLEVLRWFVKTRRAAETSRRSRASQRES